MAGRRRSDVPAELLAAAGNVEQWRRTRTRGMRMPASLWSDAVKLAERFGVSMTATVLRIGYYSLKRRCQGLSAPRQRQAVDRSSGAAPTFVELPPMAFAPPKSECLIELEKPSGARLRIRLPEMTAVDLVALGRNFWESA